MGPRKPTQTGNAAMPSGGSPMLAAERYARIADALRVSGTVTTVDLSDSLQVSHETIRRDLVVLERRGILTRVHGGATRDHSVTREEPAFIERATSESEAKQAIGLLAAHLVQPGQCVMIDVGTTALQVARALPLDLQCTVVTCSLLVAAELADHPGVTVMLSGGAVRKGDLALSGTLTLDFFSGIYPDIAFLGSGGLHATAGLTDFHLEEVTTRRAVIANALASYALVDSTKFDVIGKFRVASLGRITGFISEKQPSGHLRGAIEEQGSALLTSDR